MDYLHNNCDIDKCKNDYDCSEYNDIRKTQMGNKVREYKNFQPPHYCITLNDKQYYLTNEKAREFKVFLKNKPYNLNMEKKLIELTTDKSVNQNDSFLSQIISKYEENKDINILLYNLPFIKKHKLKGKSNLKNFLPQILDLGKIKKKGNIIIIEINKQNKQKFESINKSLDINLSFNSKINKL